MSWVPFADRLRAELADLARLGDELLDASTIDDDRALNSGGSVVFIAPDFSWGSSTTELRRRQIALVPRYDRWFERCRMIFRDAPSELREKLESIGGAIRVWLSREDEPGGWGSGWDVPSTIAAAKPKLAGWFDEIHGLLDIVAPASASQRVIALPDTSALMNSSDLSLYPASLASTPLDIFLVSPVLSELDNLKDQGRTQEVRERARAAIGVIKATRQRGSLLAGVELQPGVRVFSRPQEPDFESLPGALDRAVQDDRILAAAFELQREHPTAAVVLVTSDVNLQTKAELAEIPFAEPPAAA